LRKYIKKTILLISVFIAPIIILNLVSDSYSDDLIKDNSKIFSQQDSSVSLRKRFYLDALNTIIERPIFGIGAGNWKLTSINLDKDRIKDYQVPYHVHNDFLQIAAEAGIFSMIFYILFCLSPIFIYFLKYRGNTFKFGFEEIFLFLLPMMIFVFDSSINFPIARPINIIFYSFHLAYLIQKEK
jgi:O-antigen ligase